MFVGTGPIYAGPIMDSVLSNLHAEVDIVLTDDIYIKQTSVPEANTELTQHVHTYDHISMIAAGSVKVEVDGVELGTYAAPKGLVIKAGKQHKFITLLPNTVIYCIHNIKTAEGVL